MVTSTPIDHDHGPPAPFPHSPPPPPHRRRQRPTASSCSSSSHDGEANGAHSPAGPASPIHNGVCSPHRRQAASAGTAITTGTAIAAAAIGARCQKHPPAPSHHRLPRVRPRCFEPLQRRPPAPAPPLTLRDDVHLARSPPPASGPGSRTRAVSQRSMYCSPSNTFMTRFRPQHLAKVQNLPLGPPIGSVPGASYSGPYR